MRQLFTESNGGDLRRQFRTKLRSALSASMKFSFKRSDHPRMLVNAALELHYGGSEIVDFGGPLGWFSEDN